MMVNLSADARNVDNFVILVIAANNGYKHCTEPVLLGIPDFYSPIIGDKDAGKFIIQALHNLCLALVSLGVFHISSRASQGLSLDGKELTFTHKSDAIGGNLAQKRDKPAHTCSWQLANGATSLSYEWMSEKRA